MSKEKMADFGKKLRNGKATKTDDNKDEDQSEIEFLKAEIQDLKLQQIDTRDKLNNSLITQLEQRKKIDELNQIIDQFKTSYGKLEKRLDNLCKDQLQSNKIRKDLERYQRNEDSKELRARQANVVIKGYTAAEGETQEDLKKAIISTMTDMGLKNKVTIVNVKRLVPKAVPPTKEASSEKKKIIPNVHVQFGSLEEKLCMYKALGKWGNTPKAKGLSFCPDLPPSMIRRQKELEKQAFDLREEGKRTKIKIIRGQLQLLQKDASDSNFTVVKM